MLSVGIIGFGRIGAEHAGWLQSAQGIRAVATSDPTPARRAIAEQGGLRAHESVASLIEDKNVDAVLVSTPTAMHHEHASAALRAGKHVMVEKPIALDLAQSKSLVELAERQQRVLSVFHNRRWDIDYLTVKQAIDAGTLGKVFNIESRIGQWASCVGPAAREWRPGWRNEAGFGGGGLYDWGSHFIDQLWRMMLPAKAVRVFAQLRGNVWTKDCDDLARVLIDFDNGAAGMVEINTTTTRPLPRWHIDGSRGSGESPYSLAFDLNIWSQVTFAPADGAAAELLPRATESLSETQIWEQFAAAVRGEEEPAVLARSVLPTMTLLDAARESSRRGCAIDVDLPQ
ncbi:MAG: scyllo-inositol 2-dehydrogenase [Humisphaera sp.]|nr:scyllo-inositol 2-dehydrogenase [Humisphaera sp.]